MVQLGPSLDAVYLKVSLKGWPFCVRWSQGKGSISACPIKGAVSRNALAGTICRASSRMTKAFIQ